MTWQTFAGMPALVDDHSATYAQNQRRGLPRL